jgi:predicted Zn-dependent protease
MALKTERIRVEVTDSSEGETRTFTIILTAPNSDFQLADLLRQRGVIAPINSELKEAVKAATRHYLSGAEGLISTLTKVSTAPPKSFTNRKRKDRNTARINPTSATASELQQESNVAGN